MSLSKPGTKAVKIEAVDAGTATVDTTAEDRFRIVTE
ncbi:Uncharacterised protein [Mycobacteroides abscessus subsp. abscessus]|nr:Uncharacterised protein [Mycobacteroides abscessus subsp. abscessus]